jgi:hypothetical protein
MLQPEPVASATRSTAEVNLRLAAFSGPAGRKNALPRFFAPQIRPNAITQPPRDRLASFV